MKESSLCEGYQVPAVSCRMFGGIYLIILTALSSALCQQFDVLKVSNVQFPKYYKYAATASAPYNKDITEFTVCYRFQVEFFNDDEINIVYAVQPYMTMYEYVWTSMTMYDYVWLYMTIYDYLWPCTNKYDYIYAYACWLCMIMYDYVCLCITMYDYVWLCMSMYDYELLSITMYNWKWICMTIYD